MIALVGLLLLWLVVVAPFVPSRSSLRTIQLHHSPMDEFGDAAFLDRVDLEALDAPNPANKRPRIDRSKAEENDDEKPLEDTLRRYFGYSNFRQGQKEVIQALLDGRDVQVLWATGAGKSLCYQIPALHIPNATALVVSPLISLMQDQCRKLNLKAADDNCDLATFLGSAQTDPSAEHKAWRGDYRLVYLTPEFLGSRLAQIAQIPNLVLIAIDEAHCVSEWGHDFRKDYRQIGSRLRQQNDSMLSQVPMVALTATAIPRVQRDIGDSLHLRDPLVALRTLDRPNLHISVQRKQPDSLQQLAPLLTQSTIIYAPTRAAVEQITQTLQSLGVSVEAYHAGLSSNRHAIHTRFVTGHIPVLCATVAFGMGIDKIDTRQIVHYGTPQTLEEYYQQMGRAGRDGLSAQCWLYYNDADLDRFRSDYFVGGLADNQRAAVEQSMDALKRYVTDVQVCRRKALLEYFGEVASYERCGTCDNCRNQKEYQGDTEREFGSARLVLQALKDVPEQGTTVLLKVIGGHAVEGYRYARGETPSSVQAKMETLKTAQPKKLSIEFYRSLVPLLVQKGYLTESIKSADVGGHKRSWTVYHLTAKGSMALANPNMPILLPVPQSIRDEERKAEEKRQKTLELLEKNGIRREQLPQEEVESGEGEVIASISKWLKYLGRCKERSEDEALQLEVLFSSIEDWRSSVARKYETSPASVLAEHLLYSIAYTVATLPKGVVVDMATLESAGVRSRDTDKLVATLKDWSVAHRPADEVTLSSTTSSKMILPDRFCPSEPWSFAVYKPAKKTGLATWESSYNRFMAGESPTAIAMSPASGRPIQAATVVGHILDGMLHGREVDLKRLAEFTQFPTKAEWEALEKAGIETEWDVSGDPEATNSRGLKFTMTEYLRPIMGDKFTDTPFAERDEEEKKTFGRWCQSLKCYVNLKRVGLVPRFDDANDNRVI